MSLKKLLLIFGLCLFYLTVFAQNASLFKYDYEPITPQTWEEVDLTYVNTINGKDYIAHANLLRPIIWINQNHLDKVGSTVHLTKEQLGSDVDVKVVAIKPVKGNYSNIYKNFKPVIATFTTHSNDVWIYTFKDQNGQKEIVQSVSGHPFYSVDRQKFVPIGQFNIGEHVKAVNNNRMYLTGKRKNINKFKRIYNFEVYQKHNYKIAHKHILVHNPLHKCTPDTETRPFKCTMCEKSYSKQQHLDAHIRRAHTGEKPFKCIICEIGFPQKSDLTRHMLTHTGKKRYKCSLPGCTYRSARSDNVKQHMRNVYHPPVQPGEAEVIAEGDGERPGTSALLDETSEVQEDQGAITAAPKPPEAAANLSQYYDKIVIPEENYLYLGPTPPKRSMYDDIDIPPENQLDL